MYVAVRAASHVTFYSVGQHNNSTSVEPTRARAIVVYVSESHKVGRRYATDSASEKQSKQGTIHINCEEENKF